MNFCEHHVIPPVNLERGLMQTDPTEADGSKPSMLVMEGLPRHETRWARAAQLSRVRESSSERSARAPPMKLSVSYAGNNVRDNNKSF